jgi:anaerobic dimethyl sulfoxide reductase subunit A
MGHNTLSGNDSNLQDTIRYTCCGYHCLNRCILKVRIRNGVIIACEPDDTINAGIPREDGYISEQKIDRGMVQTRPCAKGYTQSRLSYDPRRLKYPMKRTGKRGEARFERISWDEALDTIAAKLVETKKNYGPYSIMHEPYTGWLHCSFPLAPWFGAGLAAWTCHSLGGFQEPEHWVLGKEQIASELTQDEANIFSSKLIVLWGSNPLTTLSGGFAYNLLRARDRGIPIICIESRYTPSVEVLADQWIPIRPTTDVSMMIAMANVWFKEDLWDKEYVAGNVESEGLKKWKNYVLGIDDGEDKTPSWAESICGVPAETIEKFARLYARSKPVNLIAAGSLGRQFYGENPARAIMYLQALTGNTSIRGGTCGAETQMEFGHPSLPSPIVNWQQKPGTYKPPVITCCFKWMKAVDLREKVDKGILSREEYNSMIGNVASNEPPNIQMIILESNNHLNSLPDINSNIRAMKKVDFTVVYSYFAEMPSARYADILLPQIASAFEGRACQIGDLSTDLFYSGNNLSNYFIYRQKCVDPPGEIKTNEWIWTQIAKRLGLADLAYPRLANVPDERWEEVIVDLHREAYENWANHKEIRPYNPPDWDEFQKKPIFRWEIKDPYYPFEKDNFRKGALFAPAESSSKTGDYLDMSPREKTVNLEQLQHTIGTESGKLEFYSEKLAKGPEFLAKNEFHTGTGKCYGGGNLPPMAEMKKGGKDTFYSKNTRIYPLLMSSPHSLFRVHSLLDNQQLLSQDCYRHAVWISVADAKARGIVDDDMVRVYNDIGEMILRAYVTSRLVPGTTCVFHGGWYIPGDEKTDVMPDGTDIRGAPNLLIHNEDVPDTIVGFFPCKGLVQIEKWEGK